MGVRGKGGAGGASGRLAARTMSRRLRQTMGGFKARRRRRACWGLATKREAFGGRGLRPRTGPLIIDKTRDRQARVRSLAGSDRIAFQFAPGTSCWRACTSNIGGPVKVAGYRRRKRTRQRALEMAIASCVSPQLVLPWLTASLARSLAGRD